MVFLIGPFCNLYTYADEIEVESESVYHTENSNKAFPQYGFSYVLVVSWDI